MSQPERISKGNGPDKDKSGHDETEEEQAMKPLLALLSRKKDERKALIENLQGKEKALQEMKRNMNVSVLLQLFKFVSILMAPSCSN